jgi:hypothetical protein
LAEQVVERLLGHVRLRGELNRALAVGAGPAEDRQVGCDQVVEAVLV